MTYLDIFEIIFLVVVFLAGAIGFIRAATSEEKE